MTAGHGSKLSRKQDQAIAALLAQNTIADAAKVVKVGEKTLRRWLKEPGFLREYRAARSQVVEEALALLQTITTAAVATLGNNLKAAKPSDRNRAAELILSHAIKAVELLDLEERIAELEKRSEQAQRTPGQAGAAHRAGA